MKTPVGLIALLVAVSASSMVHADTLAEPVPIADWADFVVLAKPRQCANMPAQFSVASVRQERMQSLQYVAGSNRWTWQLGAKAQTLAATFWADDLAAGVSYRDPLEVSRAPSPTLLRGLVAEKRSMIKLGCGGTAKVVRRWQAPLLQPIDNHLLDQSDLADMEGNALATVLSKRTGTVHRH